MSKSTKAVLLSAFLFPGSGHFYLKKPVQGTFLTGITVLCLYFLLVNIVSMAQEISDKIISGEIAADVVEISGAITKLISDSGIHQLNFLTIILLSCWIFGMLDSYRLGCKEEP